jgi:PAS domain-containing protein
MLALRARDSEYPIPNDRVIFTEGILTIVKNMSDRKHMDSIMTDLYHHMRQVLDHSEQAVYIYLDDGHKVCNEKFSTLLGYKSPTEWSSIEKPFAETFVDARSQQTLVSAYQKAMNQMTGSNIDVTWKRKSGGNVDTKVMLVPVGYQGHLLALHFIAEK